MSDVSTRPPFPPDPPDGVSRSTPPTPTATLITPAAAGRNPTDLTLPTAGGQAVDPPPGSHEKPGWFSSVTTWAADTAQWTWEVGSAGAMGLAQGAANTVNGV